MMSGSITVSSLIAAALVASVSVSAPLWGRCEVPLDWTISRPDPEGTPTRVQVGVYLMDLQAIDDSEQSYKADVLLGVSWKDPRLVSTESGPSLVGCRLDLDNVWTPRTVLVNERDVRRLFEEEVSVEQDGVVKYLQRLQGEFTTALDLRDFPLDSQELVLEIVTRGYSPEEIEFVTEVGSIDTAQLTITDWQIGKEYAVVEPRYIEPRNRYLAGVVFRLPVQREVGFHLMKTFLPLTLIVSMSWAVFWINPGVLPPQIGVSTSAVLTLIAFQFSLTYMLPRLTYLTRTDRFLVGSTLLVFLAFGEALFTSYLATHDHEARALTIDRWSRVLFPLGFCVVLVASLLI